MKELNYPMNAPLVAWHFLPDDGLTRFEPRQKVVVGEWLTVNPAKLDLCEYGLHASERILDALQYAPGALLCRVEIAGRVLAGDDKVCAQSRRVIAMADATNMLHEFACRAAESVLHHIPEAQRAIAQAAIDTKRRWLKGQASDSELDAAWAAAWAAARVAAWAAEGGAAWAAWAAARVAAWAAARAAERAAERAAAWVAARAAQNETLKTLACELLGLPEAA